MAFLQPRLPPLPAVFLNVPDDSPGVSRALRRCRSFPGYAPFEPDSNSEASETMLLGGSGAEDPAATWPDTDEEVGLGGPGGPWLHSTGPRTEEKSENSCKGVPLLEGLCLTPLGPPPTETGTDESTAKGPGPLKVRVKAESATPAAHTKQPVVPSLLRVTRALLPAREGNALLSTQVVHALPGTADCSPISPASKQVRQAPCCLTSHTSQQVMQAHRIPASQTSTNMMQAQRAGAQAVRKTRRMMPAVNPGQLAQVSVSSPSTRPRRPSPSYKPR